MEKFFKNNNNRENMKEPCSSYSTSVMERGKTGKSLNTRPRGEKGSGIEYGLTSERG